VEDYIRATGSKDTTFLDVGANTGIYSLFMATRVKHVHAIEPFPPVLKRLHDNIRINKFTNVTVHEVGYGEKEESLPFYTPDEVNQGDGSFRGNSGGKLVATLKIVAGDDHLRTVPMPPLSVIKMDIEGFEEAALKGLRQTLEKYRPMLLLEVRTAKQGGTIGSLDQLKSLFPANYEFFIFVPHPRSRLNGQYELTEFAPRAENFFETDLYQNLVVVPVEQVPKMPRRNLPK
jgi:FkbM family methyltransferase